MRSNPGRSPEPQTDLVKQLIGWPVIASWLAKACDELLATYTREVRLFGNGVTRVSGALGDDSRLATQDAAHGTPISAKSVAKV